jgi:hypothetical protein
MLPPQHRSETNVGDGLVSGDLGWNKRDWRLTYQHDQNTQAELCASVNMEMDVNAF